MTARTSKLDLAAFTALVETYGATRERWPVELRTAAEALVAESAEARAQLAEAEALDRILALAPASRDDGDGRLIERILQAAKVESPRADMGAAASAGQAGNVVALPLGRRSPAKVVAAAPRPRSRAGSWQAAAVLALALMTGVAIGSADFLAVPLTGLVDIVGIDTESGQTVANLHLDSLPWVMDEEQL